MSKPAPKPQPARAPRLRLDSIKTPVPRSSPRPARPPKVIPQCGNSDCGKSDIVEDDGKLICRSCGFVLSEVQITQELTFGEAANGAAVVQGVYVGANDDSARNPALGASKIIGGMDSRQITERNGLHEINNIVAALRLNTTHKDRAMRVYKLAVGHNFIQGRTTRQVAAVCLYIGCRMDSEGRVMLIDFSDLLDMNVFKLGKIYNDLVETLGLRSEQRIYDINPENLIQRFCQDLEFGKDENRIANEAVKILQRLSQDWIDVGRRPAGVCAAAVILAARMNNYRRSIREVVYTAKVADITIHKRLEEFKYTESSKLTVAEFRHHGLQLEKAHDPPAFYEQFQTKKKKRRKNAPDADDDQNVDVDDAASQRSSVAPSQRGPSRARSTRSPTVRRGRKSKAPSAQARSTMSPAARARADRQAMPPPVDPIDPAIMTGTAAGDEDDEEHLAALVASTGEVEEEEEDISDDTDSPAGSKRKRGRPLGSRNKRLPVLKQSALDDEAAMESEITTIISDARTTAAASQIHLKSTPSIEPPHTATATATPVSSSSLIDETEFDSDPEVSTCLLSESEIAIRERIWVHENGEYLRLQQARKIKRELAEANGTAPTVKKRIRHRGRMGDGAWKQTKDGWKDPKDTTEATVMFMEKRTYSTKLNYDRCVELYDSPGLKRVRERRSQSGTATPSESVSRSAEGRAGSEEGRSMTPVGSSSSLAGRAGPAKVELENGQAVVVVQNGGENAPIEIEDNGEDEDEDEDSDPDDYFQEDEYDEGEGEDGEGADEE